MLDWPVPDVLERQLLPMNAVFGNGSIGHFKSLDTIGRVRAFAEQSDIRLEAFAVVDNGRTPGV